MHGADTNKEEHTNILVDKFDRKHNYLRLSITERCNLRCTYCMPADGVELSPKAHLMSVDEIEQIAKAFVQFGVNKIRLTGGEPLIHKHAKHIIARLAALPVELAITTNAVSVERFVDCFKTHGIRTINVSLDSLDAEKFNFITRRPYFDKVYQNILMLMEEGFKVKLNVVLIKGFNDDEIIDFVQLTKALPINIRFIEFMPFNGNRWDIEKMVSLQSILDKVNTSYTPETVVALNNEPNDTAKNFKIQGHTGTFAIISSVTNPFCDSCNRIRITANGQLKNCLFSGEETDLLSAIRAGKAIEPLVRQALAAKYKTRAGMEDLNQFVQVENHEKNRSMIAIGG